MSLATITSLGGSVTVAPETEEVASWLREHAPEAAEWTSKGEVVLLADQATILLIALRDAFWVERPLVPPRVWT